ncbi:MAG: flavodoxin, partial [Limosilactobacillus sp.]
MKKFWSIFAVTVMVVATLVGFAVNPGSSAKAANNKKVLVVYFSRTQGVYGGSLKRGNTARVADFIKEKTNADTYEIVPKKAYPKSYNQTTKVAQREQNENARPAIKGKLPNVSKYDTVFVGGPIWWGEYPMVVRTFLDKESGLNGKTLIPFTTNEGSGLGNTRQVLKKQFPKSKVRKGFSARGNT